MPEQCPIFRRVLVAVATLLFALAPPGRASAYTLKTLHSFCSWATCADGEYPTTANMVMDQSGNLYGAALNGGKYGSSSDGGTVFRLAPNPGTGKWKEAVLKNFCKKTNCTDGDSPIGELIMDTGGGLYGTTDIGGTNGLGAVFKLTHVANGWVYKVLASFNHSGGAIPVSGLAYSGQASGALYDGTSPLFGVAYQGGAHDFGTAYELTTADGSHWSLIDIHDFDGGRDPVGLVADLGGNLFGTTQFGGKYGQGELYRLSKSNGVWKATVLHNFCKSANCTDGAQGAGRLLIDTSDNLFGETSFGGANGGTTCSGGGPPGCGLVFERTAGGAYKVLYNFCSVPPDCADGAQPHLSGLTMDPSGSLFGVTLAGGNQHGVAFELSPVNDTWNESVLHTFCQTDCADGFSPEGELLLDSSGNLFGATAGEGSGAGNAGTVFELKP
jgi:uncharacterized repeat protein (TIGR03803 family)